MTSDGEARVLRIGTAILAAMLAAGVVQAQQRVVRDPAEPPTRLPKTKAPARMMRGVARQSVDTKSMVELIDELVACGTRLTLSSWTDAKRRQRERRANRCPCKMCTRFCRERIL